MRDVAGVIAAEELTEVVLVGHSFGGLAISGEQSRSHAREFIAKQLLGGNADFAGDPAFQEQPRKLGHVNCLSSHFADSTRFYTEALGMAVSDRLGEAGIWFSVNTDHHVMALIEKAPAHFHHLAFDTVDIGQMRDLLDHLARHGRWLGWGPTRHGVGGNIASYVRIVEEECFVELYCDMEQLQGDHEARVWPDDRYSSNTWGPLPPRSYFRFDPVAVEWERDSREMLGEALPESSS